HLQDGLQAELRYDDGRHFRWSGDLGRQVAEFSADFGGGASELTTAVTLLTPEAALAEAVFF
ncbi:MAG TPA: glucose-6-phosphate dehydrogenase, partial [Candidatus Synoicihabitans sp.]|nr:glucose-6-phosphate dehydrogenase [Candidatus Synoicihabitans sp.]